MKSVLLLLALLSLAVAQDWWGTNDIGCIQGHIPTADENAPKHLQWARYLLDRVQGGNGDTLYDHVAGPIFWGAQSCNDRYTSVSDCNGLASAVLLQAYNLVIDSPAGFNHAYASTYWHAFVDETFGFQRIRRVEDIKEGDMIAYNYLYGKNDSQYLATQNSGHLVFVNSAPTQVVSKAPLVPDTIQWSVGIIDQTSDAHWITDSRYNISATGLGNGYMRLYTSASNGSFVGYAWSFSTGTTFYKNDVIRSAAVGRLTTQQITGCGVSISQTLLDAWVAGNPDSGVPHSQWAVTVKTTKRVKSLEIVIVLPDAANEFSSWQITPVQGKPNTYTLTGQRELPANSEFNFGYTVNREIKAGVYVDKSTC